MTKVLRIECIEVEFHQVLSTLCHQVKNLYNRANFLLKQSLNAKEKKLLMYYDFNSLLKNEECYKILPAHTAQHTLKLLCRNWRGYFRALKEWKQHPDKFFAMPRPPNYKAKNGEVVAIFTNQQARIRNGWLVLPKKVDYYYKTRLTASSKLKEVRVVPRQVGYTLELVYEKILPKKRKHCTRKGGIDLGAINIVAFVDNLGSQPIVIKDHGKGIKSIIHYYLKFQTKLREQYVQQQKKQLKHQKKLVYGSAYYHLREKFRKKLKNAIHKLTKYLIDLWIERDLHEVIIGYNPKWKQGVHFQKKITQMFVAIPFMKIINQLKYKGAEQGINVEMIPEHYTSKSSFLDNEFPQKRSIYAGKRSPRGLFTSAQGHQINADINAAYNVLLKSDPKALPKRRVNGVGGYVMYPRRVCVDPQGMIPKSSAKVTQLS
ncbi:MAG: IS200/IS605 family element transposase accessory protein TnpB [Candidatus Heimdallarchaeota archaeon]|nr:IS200/IS605 family element transposase accessory protein TnpB [Candidatus Heimdallarchaeota archaeon]